MRQRIQWIDVAKCLGIFAIYLGHFGEDAGKTYMFVFLFHVPLFFFLSGCIERERHGENVASFLQRKTKALLLPFFAFSIMSIFIYVIERNLDIGAAKKLVIDMLKGGIRNQFVAGSLWFLTCLFTMEVMFIFIKRVRFCPLIIGICLLLNAFAVKVIAPPVYAYNVDSALKYIIFFAMGYICMPQMLELFKLNNRGKKFIFGITGIGGLIFAILNFFARDIFLPLENMWGVGYLYSNIISPSILIWFVIVVSYILERVQIFNNLGKESLYLCGNEMVIKEILKCLAILLTGKEVTMVTPLTTYIYVVILIAVTHYFLIPFEVSLVKAVFRENETDAI